MIQATAPPPSKLLQGLVRVPCPLCSCETSHPEQIVAGYHLEACADCGLVYMNPRCTEEHLAEIYTVREEDDLIDLYARIASPSVLQGYEDKLKQLEAKVPKKGRLLDFACAAGYFFEQAQKRGWEAHGCDVGQWASRAAERRGLKNMHVGELDELGFPDEHFDVIYAAQVFEHLLNPLENLAKLKRLLKPGGMLYIDVPNYHTLPILWNKDDFMLNEPPQHINYFTPSTIRKLLTDSGMHSVKLSTSGGMKWENLLGQPITSDIAAAYGLVDGDGTAAKGPSLVSRVKATAKTIVRSTVVNPVFYRGMKIGMNLDATSWK